MELPPSGSSVTRRINAVLLSPNGVRGARTSVPGLPMATLQAATASNGAVVTDAQVVNQLCESHCFGNLNWEVTDDGEFVIWGYDSFDVYRAHENGEPDHEGGLVTREFLWALAEYIQEDEELDIQTAGFTKCRFPAHASRYVVRSSEVLHADLSGAEPVKPGHCRE